MADFLSHCLNGPLLLLGMMPYNSKNQCVEFIIK